MVDCQVLRHPHGPETSRRMCVPVPRLRRRALHTRAPDGSTGPGGRWLSHAMRCVGFALASLRLIRTLGGKRRLFEGKRGCLRPHPWVIQQSPHHLAGMLIFSNPLALIWVKRVSLARLNLRVCARGSLVFHVGSTDVGRASWGRRWGKDGPWQRGDLRLKGRLGHWGEAAWVRITPPYRPAESAPSCSPRWLASAAQWTSGFS